MISVSPSCPRAGNALRLATAASMAISNAVFRKDTNPPLHPRQRRSNAGAKRHFGEKPKSLPLIFMKIKACYEVLSVPIFPGPHYLIGNFSFKLELVST
jgi:hypothetical protein